MLFVFSDIFDSKSSFAILHSKSEVALKPTIWEGQKILQILPELQPPVVFPADPHLPS